MISKVMKICAVEINRIQIKDQVNYWQGLFNRHLMIWKDPFARKLTYIRLLGSMTLYILDGAYTRSVYF